MTSICFCNCTIYFVLLFKNSLLMPVVFFTVSVCNKNINCKVLMDDLNFCFQLLTIIFFFLQELFELCHRGIEKSIQVSIRYTLYKCLQLLCISVSFKSLGLKGIW